MNFEETKAHFEALDLQAQMNWILHNRHEIDRLMVDDRGLCVIIGLADVMRCNCQGKPIWPMVTLLQATGMEVEYC
jgi:hypothetical protein